MTSFVPTPSVELASTGCGYFARSSRNRPAKPPSPPIVSGRSVRATADFISSTARSPAAMSTPAAAYDDSLTLGPPAALAAACRAAGGPSLGRSRAGEGVFGGVGGRPFRLAADRPLDRLDGALADAPGQCDRVLTVEAGAAEPGLGLLGGRDQPFERDVAEGVGA